MKIAQCPASQLKGAKYNPPGRVNPKKLKSLKESIKRHGILVPVLIDKHLNIIDGHRRVQCAKELKIKVPTLILNGTLSKDEQFENINTTSCKISSADMVYIYINGGMIPQKMKVKIIELEKTIGETNLKRLANEGVSPQIYDMGKRVATYCRDPKNIDFIRSTIMWMLNHRLQYNVRLAMDKRIRREDLVKAIKGNKTLKQTWTI